jgi:hypothetical protein
MTLSQLQKLQQTIWIVKVPGPKTVYNESNVFALTQLIHINPRILITTFYA